MTAQRAHENNHVLGILGGLGPKATVSFMDEIIELTPAERDQDHIEMIVYNDPKVPDRNYPDRHEGEGPLPRLIRNSKIMEDAGADLIVIASNTTHSYHEQITSAVNVPIPHMIAVTRDHIDRLSVLRAGVLTTSTAVRTGLFDEQFDKSDVDLIYPSDMERSMESIYAFKRGDRTRAKNLMDDVVNDLKGFNIDCVILGCTEFSAMQWDHELPSIDTAAVLAQYCVEKLT